jgi:hypothetical protein
MLMPDRDMPANAGQSHDRSDEFKDFLDIFDGYNLTEMGRFHPIGDTAADGPFDESGQLLKLRQLLHIGGVVFREILEEFLDESSAAQIAQQVLGIVLGSEIPCLAFPVLVTEFAHNSPLSDQKHENWVFGGDDRVHIIVAILPLSDHER